MEKHRDIHQKPDSEPKKKGDLPLHERTPTDFRAQSMMTCQKFPADNDFNPMREYPDFKKLVESLSPNIPTPPKS